MPDVQAARMRLSRCIEDGSIRKTSIANIIDKPRRGRESKFLSRLSKTSNPAAPVERTFSFSGLKILNKLSTKINFIGLAKGWDKSKALGKAKFAFLSRLVCFFKRLSRQKYTVSGSRDLENLPMY